MTCQLTDLKNALVEASTEVISMFGLSCSFVKESEEKSLNSGEDINVVIGLSNGLKGNILAGFPKSAALKIVSGMMGGTELSDVDDMVKSGLGEFTNMMSGNAIIRLKSDKLIELSPPTLASGEDMFVMISRAPARKLFFKLGDTEFNIAYCIE